ncbi:MAG TPA: hypothetical protein VIW67_13625 [Terriglobales bacterium]
MTADTTLNLPNGDNWPQGDATGGMKQPSDFTDTIDAQDTPTYTLNPSPVNPSANDPHAGDPIQHYYGIISVGSNLGGSGSGMHVAFFQWIFYKGKGRHGAILLGG